MKVNLSRLASAAETVVLKLRATGEERWWPLLDGFAARLRAGDASAAAELLAAIEQPGGLAELELGLDNAPYLTDGDAATVNRQIRQHINHLNLLAGLAVPGSRWHQPEESPDAYEPYPARGVADFRTVEQRAGSVPRGPIDWFRVVFQGLFGAVIGAFLGGIGALEEPAAWVSYGWPMPFVVGGAIIGGLFGAVWGWGPRIGG